MKIRKFKKTLGLAFSGSGSRLIFNIGFLEELDKADITPQYIAAMSGASIVAGAYASGTMQDLKEYLFKLTPMKFFSLLNIGKNSLYSLDYIERMGKVLMKNKKFEEVSPQMGFAAADITNGKIVVLSMGDIARASRISCTLPGVFEPIKWGDKVLVDGGLLNYIPGRIAKDAGVDVVVGLNLRGSRYVFTKKQEYMIRINNLMRKMMRIDMIDSIWDKFYHQHAEQSETDEIEKSDMNMFEVLGKCVDLALSAEKQNVPDDHCCDLLISPETKKYKFIDFEKNQKELYELGKNTAIAHIPKIKALLQND